MVIPKLAFVMLVLGLVFTCYVLTESSISFIHAQQNHTNISNPQSSGISLHQLNWINNNKDKLNFAIETNIHDSTNVTVIVNVKQATSPEQTTNSSWSVISTDFVPVIENASYNFSLGLSAKDVNQLHAKVYYFDFNKTETGVDYVFGGKDGTFDANFSNVISPPKETKYMQLQFWIRQALEKDSSYILDNINIWKTIQTASTGNPNNEIETPLNFSDESDSYDTVKQVQENKLGSIMSICDRESQNYIIDEKINYEYRVWKNLTVIIKITTNLDVRDANGSLVATNSGTNAEFVTSVGLPLEDRMRIPLTCKSNTKVQDQEFLLQQAIMFTNDRVSISETTVSNYDQLTVNDPNLKAELIAQDLDFPTSMAFLGNDILVLEKDKGTVQMIVNGKKLDKPLIDMNVYNIGEMGLSGISVINDTKNTPYVYLYLTESKKGDTTIKSESLGIRIYRFEFVNNQLVNPNLLLNLPLNLTDLHVGGKMVIGPDSNIYVGIGDTGQGNKRTASKAQNNKTGAEPDGAGGILRFTQDGKPLEKGIIGNEYPLNLYYAYGIRNTFGMDFDPVTGILWDTENGNVNGDEINIVVPGFNSGWNLKEGRSKMNESLIISNMVTFNGKGKYNDPQFSWYMNYGPVGPTALTFLDSKKYGEDFENDMLVSDFNYGNVYRFDLNKDRTGLSLTGSLSDKIASKDDQSLRNIILAQAPGGITDIQIGPDGYIYILSLDVEVSDCDIYAAGCLVHGGGIRGAIFRIVPDTSTVN